VSLVAPMHNMLPDFLLSLQLSVGLVFLFSTAGKVRDLRGFLRHISEYGIVPDNLAKPAGVAVIVAEAATSFSHLTGSMLREMIPVTMALLGVFVLVVARVLLRGEHLSCLCFGANSGAITARTLARLSSLALAEVVLWTSLGAVRAPAALSYRDLTLFTASAVLLILLAEWIVIMRDLLALRGCRTCAAPGGRSTPRVLS
jgi:methylamine utilization protein MauE